MGGNVDEMGDGAVLAFRWCILRTSPGRTLGLAKSLAEAGFEAWTPTTSLDRRRPRSNVRFEVEAPILPTFVFARAVHLNDLLAAAASPINPHPPFSVFRYSGKFPLIGDAEIVGLQHEEQSERLKKLRTTRRMFARDDSVRVPEGPFAGMSGIVEHCDGKFALVGFGGNMRVKIATFLLESEALEQKASIPGSKPEPTAQAVSVS